MRNRITKMSEYKKKIILWDKLQAKTVDRWIKCLEYNYLINYFFFFKLKKIEGGWAWALIVLSSLSALVSLFQYHEDDNGYVQLAAKILLSVFTLSTTLIASWMKKQNYVDRIAELDKYILKLQKLITDLKNEYNMPPKNRINFVDYIDKYREDLVKCNSMLPVISPNHWKETVYVITKYYPELCSHKYPWNYDRHFASTIIDNYRYVKYNSFCKKLWNCYFCTSKCCIKRYQKGNRYLNELKDFYDKRFDELIDECEVNRLLDPKINLDLRTLNSDYTCSENESVYEYRYRTKSKNTNHEDTIIDIENINLSGRNGSKKRINIKKISDNTDFDINEITNDENDNNENDNNTVNETDNENINIKINTNNNLKRKDSIDNKNKLSEI